MGAAGPSERGTGAPSAGASPAAGLPGGVQALVSDEVRARVQAGSWKVPLLPQVASQVISLAASPDVDAGKLSALIHQDPSLAGQVLRTSNSAAYAPRMPIVSLQQAVARLGLNVISEIAFAASLQSGTFKVPGHEARPAGAVAARAGRRAPGARRWRACGGATSRAPSCAGCCTAWASRRCCRWRSTPPSPPAARRRRRLDRGFLASLYAQHQTAVGAAHGRGLGAARARWPRPSSTTTSPARPAPSSTRP